MQPSIRIVSHLFAGVLLGVMGLLAPVNRAHAGSQELLNEVFGMYTNMTDPQLLESQQRGGISFGSIYLRNRIVRPNLINFDPPHLRGGCQGMDLYGGSFSFINAEQLTAALRAIAGNAASYFFTLALQGVCPSCAQQIQWLRDKVEQVNKIMQDSCTAAQALVDSTGIKEWRDNRVREASTNQVIAGVQEDISSALNNFESLLQKDQSTGQLKAENTIWKAMQKNSLATWFGSYGDPELLEVLMSLTGTVLKTPTNPDGTPCNTPDGTPEYCISERHSTINMKSFMDGSRFGRVKLLRCADDTINCLNVQEREVQWRGLKERVHEILFGAGPGYTGGIIGKMRSPAGPGYTAAENAFMTNPPLPVMSLLRDSAYSAGSLNSMGEKIEEIVASQIARNLVMEMIGAVTKSFQSARGSSVLEMSAQMKDKLQTVVDDMLHTENEGERRLNVLVDMLDLGEKNAAIALQGDTQGMAGESGSADRK